MPPLAGVLLLIFVTLIWGTTFAVVKESLASIPVPLFLALRFSVAALLLVWVRPSRKVLLPGVILGVLAFVGFATQTLGLSLTGASKAAFITGLSVILTPLLGALWFRQRLPPRVFAAAALALVGLGLLSLSGAGGVNRGDLWVLACAFAYAFYILYLGEVAGKHSVLALTSVQLVTMAVLAWLWALPTASALPAVTPAVWGAIIYLAVMATVVTTLLQTLGQRVVPAHTSALIFVLEPVFAAVFAYLLLGESLGLSGWIGGALVAIAMLVSEVRRPKAISPHPTPPNMEEGQKEPGVKDENLGIKGKRSS
jgi:drug/metabolite transporter (DMT)-like permease